VHLKPLATPAVSAGSRFRWTGGLTSRYRYSSGVTPLPDRNETAPCPFCGQDVVGAVDGGDNEPCQHLVADWTRDPYDNGGGVLGESQSGNAAFAPATQLALAGRDLINLIIGDGDEALKEVRHTVFLGVLPSGVLPAYWFKVEECVNDLYAEAEPLKDKPEELARFATPVVTAIVEEVPGIKVTEINVGMIVSTDCLYAWAEDRDAATAAIAQLIKDATRSITSATAELAKQT
jgi:hypothetical protein